MNLFKKGMEKPIEIFVALFVILAVALLLLNIFEDQLNTQTEELDQIGPDRQEELMTAAQEYCMDDRRCPSRSYSEGCSTEHLARLCIAYGTDDSEFNPAEYMDLNSDGEMGFDTTQVPGIGICEDNVPCHSLVTECCGEPINAKNCKDILERHANQNGLDAGPFISNSIRSPTSECRADTSFSTDQHWINHSGFQEYKSIE